MAARNDITGDSIQTKPSKAYEENYEKIFGKNKWLDNPLEGDGQVENKELKDNDR